MPTPETQAPDTKALQTPPASSPPIAPEKKEPAPPHPAVPPPPHQHGRGWVWIIALVVVIGLVVVGTPVLIKLLNTVSTDDAYVNGHVTFVAPRVSGQVLRVLPSRSRCRWTSPRPL
jgi:membrane fusion protein (multidrug efflux system)